MREAVCFHDNVLPADQGKYGNAECEQSHDNSWNCHAKRGQTIEKKEQNQTPGSN